MPSDPLKSEIEHIASLLDIVSHYIIFTLYTLNVKIKCLDFAHPHSLLLDQIPMRQEISQVVVIGPHNKLCSEEVQSKLR